MPIHLKKAINRLMEQLIALSASVEDSVKQAVRSLEEKNIQLAEQVLAEGVSGEPASGPEIANHVFRR